jgi:hypothetical protein
MAESKIREFNFDDDFELHSSNIIYNPRKGGKTWLMSWILYNLRDQIDDIYLFSATAKVQTDAFPMIEHENRFDYFDEELIRKLMREQQELRKHNERLPKKKKIRNNIFLIIDDLAHERNVSKGKLMSELYLTGRHYYMTVFFLSQSVSDALPPKIRRNSSLIIAGRLRSIDERDILAREFLTVGMSAGMGNKHMKKQALAQYENIVYGDEFTFMCCKNTAQNVASIEDNYMVRLKAPAKLPRFSLKCTLEKCKDLGTARNIILEKSDKKFLKDKVKKQRISKKKLVGFKKLAFIL